MQLLDRALSVVMILAENPEGLVLTEVSKKGNLPVSTAHRILKSLENTNFVVKNVDSKKFYLSYKFLTIAKSIEKHDVILSLSKDIMKDLSRNIHKTVVLCGAVDDKIINLDYAEYVDSSIYKIKKGMLIDMHLTSAGRVFLANVSENKLNKYIEKHNLNDDFKEVIKKVKEDDYCMIDEELQNNIQGVSAPVRDGYGKIVAVLAFTTIKSINPIKEDEIIKLKKYAGMIEERIK